MNAKAQASGTVDIAHNPRASGLACRSRHFSIILACSGPMEITTSDLRCLYAIVDEAPYWRHGVKSRLTGEYAPQAEFRHICDRARTV